MILGEIPMPTTLEPLQIQVATRARFDRLAADWKKRSRYFSNGARMAYLKPYQHIIGMGWSAVPLILLEMAREPDQWFWALESITEENPVPSDLVGNVRESTNAWLEWGRSRGVIES